MWVVPMSTNDSVRLDALRDIRLEFGFVKTALKRLGTLQSSTARPGEGRVFSVVGDTRSGKTTILDLHEEKLADPAPRPSRIARLTLLRKCKIGRGSGRERVSQTV